MKPRLCPHCYKAIPVDKGYYFDTKLNLVCAACGKIVLPTDVTSETEIAALVRNKNRNGAVLPHSQQWGNFPAQGAAEYDTQD